VKREEEGGVWSEEEEEGEEDAGLFNLSDENYRKV